MNTYTVKASRSNDFGHKEVTFGRHESFKYSLQKALEIGKLALLFDVNQDIVTWVEDEEGNMAFPDGSGKLWKLISLEGVEE